MLCIRRHCAWHVALGIVLCHALLTSAGTSGLARVEARFRMVADEYVLGEPMYVELLVHNGGEEVLELPVAEHGGGSFMFSATGADGKRVPEHVRESVGIGMRTRTPVLKVLPNAEAKLRAVLGKRLQIRKPGNYSLWCGAWIGLAAEPDVANDGSPGRGFVAEARLALRVKPFEAAKVRSLAMDLVRLLDSSDHNVAAQAAEALGCVHPTIALPLLARAVHHSDYTVRREAVMALARSDGEGSVAGLLAALSAEDSLIKSTAARALGRTAVGDKGAASAVSKLLVDEYWGVRWAAVQALDSIGDREALLGLRPLLRDTNDWVRDAAYAALARHGELGEVSPKAKTATFSRAADQGEREAEKSPWQVPWYVIAGIVVLSGLALLAIVRARRHQA